MTVESPAFTRVDLLRHGQVEGGRCYRGQRDDPLAPGGWEQMRAAVRPDEHWDVIVSSPLLRCLDFARELSAARGIPLRIEPSFREISFGQWEGLSVEQICALDGDHLAAFWADPDANPPPGGESLHAFNARVVDGWHRWIDAFRGRSILVVTHGGVVRMILACVLDAAPERTGSRLHVPHACRSRIRLDDSEHGRLACLVSHGDVNRSHDPFAPGDPS